MKSFTKRVLYVLVGIVILAIAGYVVWQKFKYQIVKRTVEAAVAAKTDSLYTVKYDSLDFNTLTGNASISNIRIIPDTARAKNLPSEKIPDFMLDVGIRSITLTGVKRTNTSSGTLIEADSVIIHSPVITLYSMRPLQKGSKIESEAGNFYKSILGKLKLVKVGFVFISNVNVQGIDINSKEKDFDFINGKFLMEDVLIDSAHNLDTSRVLFCRQAAFTVDSFFSYDHNRKEFSVKDVSFLGREKLLLFDEIAINRFESDTGRAIRLLDAKTLKLSGVNSNKAVRDKILFVDTILCKQINLYELPLANLKTTGGNISKSQDSTGFANVYGIYMKHLNFPSVSFIPFAKSNYSVGNIAVKINGVNADQIVNLESHPMDYTKEAAVAISSFAIKSGDQIYHFEFKNIVVNSLAKQLTVGSFDIVPFLAEKQFANHFPVQKDRYDVSMQGISLNGIDMNSLVDKHVKASSLIIENINANISRDLHKPLEKKSKVGNYLSQLLKNLNQPVNIASATVKNALVRYRENEHLTDEVGDITFENTSFDISNITNMPDAIEANNQMVISFATKVLGKIPLKGNFKFNLKSDKGRFTTTGHAGAFDATLLNKISIPMGLIKINSGRINSLDFNLRGNDAKASGDLVMLYDNLNLDILKFDKVTRQVKKRGFLTKAANKVVKDANPLGGEVRKATPEYDRDIYKSFFNLIWKTIFTGIKQTVGIP